MKKEFDELKQIQQLVIDIIKVERNHFIPKTKRHENVVEHSFSLAILCWKIFEMVKPPLNITKILKYALAHDFIERGQSQDVNTYAKENERQTKKERENEELTKLSFEFEDFADLTTTLKNYETQIDEESLFVWTVDKMQEIVLGQIDDWRPYADYGVKYKQFCDKCEEFLVKSSPYLKNIFVEVFEESKKTYYDRP